jgi:hypothetical protein
MRTKIAVLMTTGFAGVANAHTLAADEGLFHQLYHQVLGLHHLPILLLIAIAGWLVVRKIRRPD